MDESIQLDVNEVLAGYRKATAELQERVIVQGAYITHVERINTELTKRIEEIDGVVDALRQLVSEQQGKAEAHGDRTDNQEGKNDPQGGHH